MIIDNTEQNLVAFRRNIYLTIQSSLDFQEAAHKLLKIDLKSGQDVSFSLYLFFVMIVIRNEKFCYLGGTLQHDRGLLCSAKDLREVLWSTSGAILSTSQGISRSIRANCS